ncbi:MAG: hypothetical protein V1854_04040 [Methanobacteriota archaeon]
MLRLLTVLALLAILFMPISSASEPVNVETGIYIISLGNYEVNKGTYTMDFYMWFRWDASSNITPFKFEFMNGRANSKELISDETDIATGKREVWYRIQASLYSEPRFKDYPFDTQVLKIDFEDSINPVQKLQYTPAVIESGLDKDVRASGWIITGWDFIAADKEYKWDEIYSRGNFAIDIEREKTSTAIKTLLPPFIFCVVSGLSFFFRPDKIAQRLGLGTSMLISAVMFHISQTASLPPLGFLMLIDKIMISTYVFLASSLIVTTIIHIDVDWWQKVDYTRETNRYGAVVTVLLPIITYLALSGV